MAHIPNRSDYATAYAFEPTGGVSLACTTASARMALSGHGPQVVVTNYGSVVAFVAFGVGDVEATTSSKAVLPGTEIALTIPHTNTNQTNPATHVAGITATSTTTLQISQGYGI
jgi:hypothetical protein